MLLYCRRRCLGCAMLLQGGSNKGGDLESGTEVAEADIGDFTSLYIMRIANGVCTWSRVESHGELQARFGHSLSVLAHESVRGNVDGQADTLITSQHTGGGAGGIQLFLVGGCVAGQPIEQAFVGDIDVLTDTELADLGQALALQRDAFTPAALELRMPAELSRISKTKTNSGKKAERKHALDDETETFQYDPPHFDLKDKAFDGVIEQEFSFGYTLSAMLNGKRYRGTLLKP